MSNAKKKASASKTGKEKRDFAGRYKAQMESILFICGKLPDTGVDLDDRFKTSYHNWNNEEKPGQLTPTSKPFLQQQEHNRFVPGVYLRLPPGIVVIDKDYHPEKGEDDTEFDKVFLNKTLQTRTHRENSYHSWYRLQDHQNELVSCAGRGFKIHGVSYDLLIGREAHSPKQKLGETADGVNLPGSCKDPENPFKQTHFWDKDSPQEIMPLPDALYTKLLLSDSKQRVEKAKEKRDAVVSNESGVGKVAPGSGLKMPEEFLIPEGKRRSTNLRWAYRLACLGLREDDIVKTICSFNEVYMMEPRSEEDTREIVRDAIEKTKQEGICKKHDLGVVFSQGWRTREEFCERAFKALDIQVRLNVRSMLPAVFVGGKMLRPKKGETLFRRIKFIINKGLVLIYGVTPVIPKATKIDPNPNATDWHIKHWNPRHKRGPKEPPFGPIKPWETLHFPTEVIDGCFDSMADTNEYDPFLEKLEREPRAYCDLLSGAGAGAGDLVYGNFHRKWMERKPTKADKAAGFVKSNKLLWDNMTAKMTLTVIHATYKPGDDNSLMFVFVGPQNANKSGFGRMLSYPELEGEFAGYVGGVVLPDGKSDSNKEAKFWNKALGSCFAEVNEARFSDERAFRSTIGEPSPWVTNLHQNYPVQRHVRHAWIMTANKPHILPPTMEGERRVYPMSCFVKRKLTKMHFGNQTEINKYRMNAMEEKVPIVVNGETLKDEDGNEHLFTVRDAIWGEAMYRYHVLGERPKCDGDLEIARHAATRAAHADKPTEDKLKDSIEDFVRAYHAEPEKKRRYVTREEVMERAEIQKGSGAQGRYPKQWCQILRILCSQMGHGRNGERYHFKPAGGNYVKDRYYDLKEMKVRKHMSIIK